jgi:hypothetical protein
MTLQTRFKRFLIIHVIILVFLKTLTLSSLGDESYIYIQSALLLGLIANFFVSKFHKETTDLLKEHLPDKKNIRVLLFLKIFIVGTFPFMSLFFMSLLFSPTDKKNLWLKKYFLNNKVFTILVVTQLCIGLSSVTLSKYVLSPCTSYIYNMSRLSWTLLKIKEKPDEMKKNLNEFIENYQPHVDETSAILAVSMYSMKATSMADLKTFTYQCLELAEKNFKEQKSYSSVHLFTFTGLVEITILNFVRYTTITNFRKTIDRSLNKNDK